MDLGRATEAWTHTLMEIDLAQLEFIDRMLRKMVLDAEREFKSRHNFVVTSQLRIDDPGVHGQLPLRGIDIRCRHNQSQVGEKIVNWTNSHYQYDPNRPHMLCCIYHDTGLGPHLHFQVHPNTIRRRWRHE